MKIHSYRNARYINSDLSSIDLEIETDSYGWIPTTVILGDNDQEPHVLKIKQWLVDHPHLVSPYAVDSHALQEMVLNKRDQIRNDFMEALIPSVEALGIQWNSGMNSSVAIDGAARIAEAAGALEVTIHSVDNKPHLFSLAQTIQVAVAIGLDYQQKFAVKQSRMVALDEIDLTESSAIEQIGAI